MPASTPNKTISVLRNAVPLPTGVTRDDIYVDVSVSNELRAKSDIFFHTGLVNDAHSAVEKVLRQMYTAKSEQECKYELKVFLLMVSDGSVSGTISVNAASIGQVVVRLAWRLLGNEKDQKEQKVYSGGMINLKQQMDYTEYFNMFESHGQNLLLDQLAPKCAYNIASEIGIASTKYYHIDSS